MSFPDLADATPDSPHTPLSLPLSLLFLLEGVEKFSLFLKFLFVCFLGQNFICLFICLIPGSALRSARHCYCLGDPKGYLE